MNPKGKKREKKGESGSESQSDASREQGGRERKEIGRANSIVWEHGEISETIWEDRMRCRWRSERRVESSPGMREGEGQRGRAKRGADASLDSPSLGDEDLSSFPEEDCEGR